MHKPKIINTTGWLKGSVIYYNYACTQCDN